MHSYLFGINQASMALQNNIIKSRLRKKCHNNSFRDNIFIESTNENTGYSHNIPVELWILKIYRCENCSKSPTKRSRSSIIGSGQFRAHPKFMQNHKVFIFFTFFLNQQIRVATLSLVSQLQLFCKSSKWNTKPYDKTMLPGFNWSLDF